MKLILLMAVTIVTVACGSGGGGSKSPSSSGSTQPSISNAESNAQQTINDDYPPIAFDAASNLKDYAEFPIGVEVEAGDELSSIFDLTEQQPVITQHFSEIVAGNIMKTPALHPEENTFFFDDADELVDFALANNLQVHGHTLVWYFMESNPVLPDWMLNYAGDWDAMIHNHITQIVSHFKGKVHSWDVVNEAIKGTAGEGNIATAADYEDSPFYQAMGADFIENAFISADQADPDAILYYNDWALSHNDARLDFTLAMIDDFIDRSIPIDGIGFQMHTWLTWPSIATIKTAFEKAAATGLMVKITELDIRQASPYTTDSSTTLTAELSLQYKNRYADIVMAYKHAIPPEQRGGISFWGLADKNSWLKHASPRPEWPLLFNDDYTVKPSFYGVIEGLTH